MRIAKLHEFRLDKVEDSEEIELDLSPCAYYDNLDLFDNDKEFRSFIIRLKYYLRHSYEYSRLMKHLKEQRGMDRCGVHPNVKRTDGFAIHIHHTPFTMEDIVYIILKKRKETRESLKMSDIATEVMYLHYLGAVGLYPLCETCHQYAHSDANDLFIPLNVIYGNPEAFVKIYEPYLKDTPLMTKFENILTLNKGYTLIEESVPLGLRKKYIYVKMKSKEIKNEDEQYVLSTRKLYDLMKSDKFKDLCLGSYGKE